MSSSVTIKQYKKIINFVSRIKKDHSVNIPLFIWGSHGIGKTTVTSKTAKENNNNCVVLNLANQSPEELLGNPVINKKSKTTEYFKPDWFMVEDKETPCIYFLDEINRAPKYVLQSIFNFINEGRLHKHQINDHDVVIAAGNPSNFDYDVTDFDDEAFISRFAHLYLEPTQLEFITYYTENKLHPVLIDTVKDNTAMVENIVTDEKEMLKVSPDPRMMEKVGHILNIITKKEFKEFGINLIAGMVGWDIANVISDKFLNYSEIPDPSELLKGKLDLNVFSEDRIDIINAFNTKLSAYLMKKGYLDDCEKMSKKECKMILNYTQVIPKDCFLNIIREFHALKINSIKVLNFFKKFDPSNTKILSDLVEASSTSE